MSRTVPVPLQPVDSSPASEDAAGIGPPADGGMCPPAVAIQTQGCKLNQADSEALARRFIDHGYRLVDSIAEADVLVLNTCTVTATADAKARQSLRAAHRANPEAMIVATGCYAQRAPAELTGLDGVALVVGNTHKEHLVARVGKALGIEAPVQGEPSLDPRLSPSRENSRGKSGAVTPEPGTLRNRAMVKIQEGCNQVCAYCIVPKVRGRERSIPPHTLVRQVQQRVAEGFREVVLTGTQLGSYGFDLPDADLTGLLQRILMETEVTRLRVSSLQPQEVDSRLLDLWRDRRLCPHFHLPLQSGSDLVLRAMRRRYTIARFAETVDLIQQTIPDAGITADVIVGFPGEEEADFRESREFAQSMRFSDMHVFPFSPRPGTSAGYFRDQVSEPVKKGRVAEMLEVASEGFRRFRLDQLGQTRPVLWESVRDVEGLSVWSGLTDNYIRVHTHSPRHLHNLITPAHLVEPNGDRILATLPP